MKRLLITGPRLWTDTNVISGALVDVRETWPQETIVLVSGNAKQMMLLAEAAHAAGLDCDSSMVGRPTCAANCNSKTSISCES